MKRLLAIAILAAAPLAAASSATAATPYCAGVYDDGNDVVEGCVLMDQCLVRLHTGPVLSPICV